MKIRNSRKIVYVAVFITVAWVSPVSWVESSDIVTLSGYPQSMFDPLFGIEYQPSEVRFETAPNVIYKCSDLRSPRRKLFLFGKATKGKVHFYYVYGLVEVDRSGPSGDVKEFEAESDDGIIVVISPSGCRDIGAGYAWSPDKHFRREAEIYGITEDVVAALLIDAVDREVKAFGGATKFLRRLAAAGVDESKLPRQVRDKLTAIRGKTRAKSPKSEFLK